MKRKLRSEGRNMKRLSVKQNNHFRKNKGRIIEYRTRNNTGVMHQMEKTTDLQTTDSEEEYEPTCKLTAKDVYKISGARQLTVNTLSSNGKTTKNLNSITSAEFRINNRKERDNSLQGILRNELKDEALNTQMDIILNDSVLDNNPVTKLGPLSINIRGQNKVDKIVDHSKERRVFDEQLNAQIDCILNDSVLDNYPLEKFDPSSLISEELKHNIRCWDNIHSYVKELEKPIPEDFMKSLKMITQAPKENTKCKKQYIREHLLNKNKKEPSSATFCVWKGKQQGSFKKSDEMSFMRYRKMQEDNSKTQLTVKESTAPVDLQGICVNTHIQDGIQQDCTEKYTKIHSTNSGELEKSSTKTGMLCVDPVRRITNVRPSGSNTHKRNIITRNSHGKYQKMHLMGSKKVQESHFNTTMSCVKPTKPANVQDSDSNTCERNIFKRDSHEKYRKVHLARCKGRQKSNTKTRMLRVESTGPSTNVQELGSFTQENGMTKRNSHEIYQNMPLLGCKEVHKDNIIKTGVPCAPPSEPVPDKPQSNRITHKRNMMQSNSYGKYKKMHLMNNKVLRKSSIKTGMPFMKPAEISTNTQESDGYEQKRNMLQCDSEEKYQNMHLMNYREVQNDNIEIGLSCVEQAEQNTDKQVLSYNVFKRNSLQEDLNEQNKELNLMTYKGLVLFTKSAESGANNSTALDNTNKENNVQQDTEKKNEGMHLVNYVETVPNKLTEIASDNQTPFINNHEREMIQEGSNKKNERMNLESSKEIQKNNIKTQTPFMEPLEVICDVKITVSDNNNASKGILQNSLEKVVVDDIITSSTTANAGQRFLNISSTQTVDSNTKVQVNKLLADNSIYSNCSLISNVFDGVQEIALYHDDKSDIEIHYSDSDDECKLVIDETTTERNKISDHRKPGLIQTSCNDDVTLSNVVMEHDITEATESNLEPVLATQSSVNNSAESEEAINVEENLPKYIPNFYVERDFTPESSPAVNIGVIRCLNKPVTLPVIRDEKFCDVRCNLLHTCYFYYLAERCSLAFKKLRKNNENTTRQKIIETVLVDLKKYKGKLCNNTNHKDVKNQKSENAHIPFSAKIRMKKLEQACCARRCESKGVPKYNINDSTDKIILWAKSIEKEETILSRILEVEDNKFYKIVKDVTQITSTFDTNTSVKLIVKIMISECVKFENIKDSKSTLMKFVVYAFEKTQVNPIFAKKLLRECERIMISNECSLNMTAKVRTVASFVAAYCRRFDDKRYINHLIYKVLYSLKYKSHAIIDALLSIWPAAFKSSTDNLNILDKTVIFSIYNIEVRKYSNHLRVNELSYKLTKYLQHKRPEITSENLAEELMNNIDSKRWFRSVILLSKRKDFRWAHRSIVHRYLIPILNHWIKETHNVSEGTVVKCVRALGKIMRTLPRHTAYNIDSTINVFSQILFNTEKGSRLLKEAVVSEISRLAMVDYKPCINILKKWKPIDNKISVNLMKTMNSRIFHKNCFRLWWSKVIRDDDIHAMLNELLISKQ